MSLEKEIRVHRFWRRLTRTVKRGKDKVRVERGVLIGFVKS